MKKLITKARPSLISLPAAVLMLLVTFLLLYILFPSSLFFENDQVPKDPNLGRAYLRAALAQDPNNEHLKQKLAEVEIKLGDLTSAAALLDEISASKEKAAIEQQLYYAKFQAGTLSIDDKAKLVSSLESNRDWTPQQLQYAQALGLEAQLAQYYQDHDQPLLAARTWLAANHPEKASELYGQHLSKDTLNDAIAAALAAGQPVLAYQWWQQYGDQSDLQRALKLAQLAGNSKDTQRLADQLLAQEPNNAQRLALAEQAHLANGDIQGAEAILEQRLALQPNNQALHQRRWQLLRWLNRPADALDELRWLMADGSATLADVEASLNDANGLFRYDDQIAIYRYLAGQHRLSPQRFDSWLDAQEWQGTPEQAVADIHHYQQRYGKDSQSDGWLARLNHEMGDQDALRTLWPTYKGPRDDQHLIWFARAYWLENDYKAALAVLKNGNTSKDVSFWDARAEMAWRVGNKAEATFAYQRLHQLAPNLPGLEYRYQQARFGDDKPGLLAYLWTRPRTASNVARIAELCWQLQDEQGFARLAAVLPSQPADRQLASAWLYVGTWQQQHQQLEEARASLRQAKLLAPGSTEVALSQGWLALALQDKKAAQAILDEHQQQPASDAWAPLLGSLAQFLGDHRQAYFYFRYMAKRQPKDLANLVNLASEMEALGRHDDAFRLTRYLARQLPQNQQAYADLQLNWWGERVVPFLQARLGMDTIAPMTPEQAASYWWLHRQAAKRLLPWQQLQLAMLDGDFHTVKSLLAKGQVSQTTDKVSAWLYLNRPYQAMEAWDKGVTREATETELDLARAARPAHFRALAFWLQPDAGLKSAQQQVELYLPFAQAQWKFSAGYQDNQGNDGNLMAANADWQYQRWHLNLDVDHHQGEGAVRSGLAVAVDYQWDQRTRLGLDIATGQESRQSDVLLAWGEQSLFGVNANYRLDNRQSLALSAAHLKVGLRDGPSLASGQQYDARYQFDLLADRPGWALYGAAIWQSFPNRPPVPVPHHPEYQALVEPFRRYAIGSVWGPGAELTPPHLGAEPAWTVDVSVGYQPRIGQADFTLSTGAGWSVTGDDLLQLKLNYQSSNRQGASDTQVQLGYYLHF